MTTGERSGGDERAGAPPQGEQLTGGAAGELGGRGVVVGSINTDLVVRARALPRPGETLTGEEFTIVGGGKGANAAVAAARLGGSVALVACVGNDDFGSARLAELAREGLDLGGVRRVEGATSGVALITVDAAGENSIVVVPGTNGLLAPDALVTLSLGRGDVLLTQLEIPLATVEAALRHARAARATAVLNAAPFRPDAGALLPLVDVLVVNEVEAADLLGRSRIAPDEALDAVDALLGRGAGAVALTLGAHGAAVGRGEQRRQIPAPSVAVVDTTAAGDAFTGALAGELVGGRDFFAAAETAVRAGSLAVTRRGAQPSLPRLAELRASS